MSTNKVIQCLRSVELLGEKVELTDGQLLETFITRRDPTAIEALVRRHGPMVWGVCRRLLLNHHDAEDAYQATFLVLVRKANSIRPREMVGNWLYGVARTTALKAKSTNAKRQSRETLEMRNADPIASETKLWDDLEPLLDQELGLLPDKYRAVIVLCDLEGKTRQEAATSLGCPEGTIASRLSRARTMLAERLARRGVALSGVALSTAIGEKATSAIVPTTVMASTINAASLVATGLPTTSSAGSPAVAALTERVMRTMLLKRLRVIFGLLVAAVLAIAATSIPWRDGALAQDVKPATESVEEVLAPIPNVENKVELVLQTGHSGIVLSANYSPDGKRIVSAANDHTAIIWDAETSRQLRTLQGHTSSVNSANYSPDGKRIVTTSEDATVIVWDSETGQKLLSFRGETSGTRKLVEVDKASGSGMIGESFASFSPDGKRIVTGFRGSPGTHTATVWDAQTGEKLLTLGRGRAPAFSPDGKQIVTAGYGEAIIWDAQTGMEIRTLGQKEDFASYANFSPDGKRIATACHNNSVNIWEAETGKKLLSFQVLQLQPGRAGGLQAALYSPDGKQIIARSSGGVDIESTTLWNAETGEKLHTLTGRTLDGRTLFGRPGMVNSACYSPDSKRIVGAAGGVKVWDAATGNALSSFPTHFNPNCSSFSPDGKRFITASRGIVSVWDSGGGEKVNAFTLRNKGGYASFSPDGKQIVTASGEIGGVGGAIGKGALGVSIWDAETGMLIRSLSGSTASYSLDGKRIVTISVVRPTSNTVIIWDADNGKQLQAIPGNFASASLSPDGKQVATTSASMSRGGPKSKDGDTVTVWDVETGRKVYLLRSHTDTVRTTCYSPNGKQLITAGADNAAIVWDAETGEKVRALEGHKKTIWFASFSPDSKKIVTAAEDNAAIIWDAGTGVKLRTLQGHTGSVWTAGFSPAGKRIITAAADGTTRFWDVETGLELCAFLSFIVDNNWLVVTPGGFFDGSAVGLKKVAVRTDGKLNVGTEERFMNSYHRPALLAEIFGNKVNVP
jgi:RNA polymerase sigma factor (sigma-70 family)